MLVEDFDYSLPESLIAKWPVTPRDHCRLLVVDRPSQKIDHRHFYNVVDFLREGDCIVVNNTKVISARLFARSEDRTFEIFLLKPRSLDWLSWSCLVRPGKKIKAQRTFQFSKDIHAEVTRTSSDDFEITFSGVEPAHFLGWLDQHGKTPLPPYLKREAEEKDRETYQTVFAEKPASVAAPTAGLHFTKPLLVQLKQKGVELLQITLDVGYGSFAPMRTHHVEDHPLHEERYEIAKETFERLKKTKKRGGRVIAVGTTSVRTLESIPTLGLEGETQLFIRPGHHFTWVDGLITNFHLPKSSLFVLVCAFLGSNETKRCYEEAIFQEYRFYSYGDSMLIL